MTQRYDITGMHCQSCVSKLTAALERVAGVRSANVSLSPPLAVIETDTPVSSAALAHAAREAGNYTIAERSSSTVPDASTSVSGASVTAASADAPPPLTSLYPLALIITFILGITALTTFARGPRDLHTFLNDFMAGFFLVFSFFKFLDLRGFANAYQSYDIIARRSRAWAFTYPFVELALGVAYLLHWQPVATNAVTLGLMLVGSVGVINAVRNKQRIRCACLGTALNLPMTTVTIIEDLGMAAMAALMLLLPA